MQKDFRDKFRKKIGLDIRERISDIDSPMLQGFAILKLAKDFLEIEKLTADDVCELLLESGVSLKKESLTKAFSRAGDRIHRFKINGFQYYQLMTPGLLEISELLNSGNIGVSYIESGKPRTARKSLNEIFLDFSGDIRISDPYYGIKSLDTIDMIPTQCNVLLLTVQPSEKKTQVQRAYTDYQKEKGNLQIKIYPNSSELHDRYIITDEIFMLLGHGIKDIGGRESFIIVIHKSLAPDLHDNMKAIFDERWNKSQPL